MEEEQVLDWIKTYAIGILSSITISLLVLLFLCSWYAYSLSGKLQTAREQLAIIHNHSEEQKIKTVIVEKKIKEIQWKTKERIRYVTTFVYDTNKSDCDNGMALLRTQF
ncbi:MAG TPA: hypothetical protein VIR31_00080 [Nitrososphaeraceae archaeon]